jgi:hypothetical protein
MSILTASNLPGASIKCRLTVAEVAVVLDPEPDKEFGVAGLSIFFLHDENTVIASNAAPASIVAYFFLQIIAILF